MNALDWLVLLGTIVGIAAYGTWRTRHTDKLDTYLKGGSTTKWFTIGLSVIGFYILYIVFISCLAIADYGIGYPKNHGTNVF